MYLGCASLFQIAKALGSKSIRHPSDTFTSDRCLINVDPKVFAIWDSKERKTTFKVSIFCCNMKLSNFTQTKWNIEISSKRVVHGNVREETIDVVKQNRNHSGTFWTFLYLHSLQYCMIHNSRSVILANEFNSANLHTRDRTFETSFLHCWKLHS